MATKDLVSRHIFLVCSKFQFPVKIPDFTSKIDVVKVSTAVPTIAPVSTTASTTLPTPFVTEITAFAVVAIMLSSVLSFSIKSLIVFSRNFVYLLSHSPVNIPRPKSKRLVNGDATQLAIFAPTFRPKLAILSPTLLSFVKNPVSVVSAPVDAKILFSSRPFASKLVATISLRRLAMFWLPLCSISSILSALSQIFIYILLILSLTLGKLLFKPLR